MLTQSIALALAKHCIGTCKALHWHLQSIALAHAKHCGETCKLLYCELQQAYMETLQESLSSCFPLKKE